jgi:hypothetical protein
MHSQAGTASALEQDGFLTPNVLYRLGTSQQILVVYDGGPAHALEAIRAIETAVWENEPYRFDELVLQRGNRTVLTVGYAELESSLPPRQAGYGTLPLSFALQNAGAAEGFLSVFSRLVRVTEAATIVFGVSMLIATLAFGFGAIARARRGAPDEASQRLFA